jgi:type I restriction enzyme S subunit
MVMSDVPKGRALAKCYLIEKDDTYTLNQRICAIRTDRFHNRFLLYHLNRHPYLLAFDNKGSQANLRKTDILSCPLFVPSDEDQENIAADLDATRSHTRRLESNYQRKLDALDELKKSLLHQAFSGQL